MSSVQVEGDIIAIIRTTLPTSLYTIVFEYTVNSCGVVALPITTPGASLLWSWRHWYTDGGHVPLVLADMYHLYL